MGRAFFTADWHNGEDSAPNTHSFLRPRPTAVMVGEWLAHCNEVLRPDDRLFFLGDLVINLDDLEIYRRLPCNLFVVAGDKETRNKNFTAQEFEERFNLIFPSDRAIYTDCAQFITIGNTRWRMAHKPVDLLDSGMPALCGHVHGIWRTQCMPNGLPIINVGIDAWGGLVSEEMIMHQYNAIMQGHYDRNARVDLWKI